MQGLPQAPFDTAKVVRIGARVTMSCRWRRLAGRSRQAKKPLWLPPGTRQIRPTGQLAFSAAMKPKVSDVPLSRRRPRLFQDVARLLQDRILTPQSLQLSMKVYRCILWLTDVTLLAQPSCQRR